MTSTIFAEPTIHNERVRVDNVPQEDVVDEQSSEPTVTWHQYAEIEAPTIFWQKLLELWATEDGEGGTIDRLEVGYALLMPIPYRTERIDDGTYVASFEAANVSISGTSFRDAYQSLIAEILDSFDTLLANETVLGPDAKEQLEVLRRYIGKT